MSALRILVLLPHLPCPCRGGADIRNWQNIRALAEYGKVEVVGLLSPDKDYATPDLEQRVTWHSFSGFRKGEGQLSGMQILSRLRNLFTDYYYTDENIAAMKQILERFKPQVAVVSHLVGYLFTGILKDAGCKVISDCHNVEGLLAGKIEVNEFIKDRRMIEYIKQNVGKVEKRLCLDADLVWVCSETDREIIRPLYNLPGPVHVVPNTIDVETYRNRTPVPQTILFPATFSYEPNRNAAEMLMEKIFPRVAENFPDAELWLPGKDPAPAMLAAATENRAVVVPGQVDDMRDYLSRAAVMAVPLYTAGGTRLKILEAFASRLAVVTTAEGAEGIDGREGEHLLLAEDEEQFTEKIGLLFIDSVLRERLTQNAYRLVSQSYSSTALMKVISGSLAELAIP